MNKLAEALAALPGIRERCEKASDVGSFENGKPVAGGWEVRDYDGTTIHTKYDHPQAKGPMPIVCLSIGVKEPQYRVHIRKQDAEFIAASRTDLPLLCDGLEAARERIAELERQKFINNIVAIGVENGERIDREKYLKALAEIEAQRERIAALEALTLHCWIHSGYPDCGFDQMDSAMKALYREAVKSAQGAARKE